MSVVVSRCAVLVIGVSTTTCIYWYYFVSSLFYFLFIVYFFSRFGVYYEKSEKWGIRSFLKKCFFKLSVLLVLRHYYREFFCTLWKGLYIYFNFLLAMFVYFHESSKWKVYFGVERPFLCKSRIWILGSIIIIINSSLCSVAYFYGLQKCRLTYLLAYVLFIKTLLSIFITWKYCQLEYIISNSCQSPCYCLANALLIVFTFLVLLYILEFLLCFKMMLFLVGKWFILV